MCWMCESNNSPTGNGLNKRYIYSNMGFVTINISGPNVCYSCLDKMHNQIADSKCLFEDILYPVIDGEKLD